jgi:hypothetical protein
MLVPTLGFAQSVTKEDFAYGVDVNAEADSYYEVGITEELYAGIQSPNLHDLRVFGPDGNSVPYLIKRQKQVINKSESSKSYNFFPVSVPVGFQHPNNLHVKINQKGDRMSVDVRTNNATSAIKKETAFFYVVDLGEKYDEDIKSMQIQWNEKTIERSRITVSTSSDLTRWRRAGQGTLINLTHDGNQLRHDTIELNKYDRYLKLASDKAAEFRLNTIETNSRHEEAIKNKPTWKEITGTRRAENEYYYKTPGNFPVDYLEITPVVHNTSHNILMRSGPNVKDINQTRFRGQSYLLKVGEDEVRSAAISLFGTTHRHWLLTVLDKDQSIAPKLSVRIGWYPHVVHFISSKPGTYTIAYGSTAIKHQGTLLPSALLKDEYAPVRVESGHPRSIGGVEQLEPPLDRSKYAKWTLWTILSVTLLVVGYMALRLFGHMSSAD